MYQQQMQQQQLQALAGICFNQVDMSTFNPNLPNQNDKFPQIAQSQWLQNQQAQQFVGQAVAIFRLRIQERAQRTFLHTWAYNRISQNQFQNQIWNDWGNKLASFLEYLMVVQPQNNPPQTAIPKAADTMFKCYLATCSMEQPQLQQFVAQDAAMVQDLNKHAQLIGVIMQDINAYRSGRMMAPQQQQQFQQPQQFAQYGGQMVSMSQPGNGQLPAINTTMQYGQPQTMAPMQMQSMQVGGSAMLAPQPMVIQPSSGAGANMGMDYGTPEPTPAPAPQQQTNFLAAPTASLNPVESYGVSVAPVNTVAPPAPALQAEELDRPVPMSAKDVVFDPHYHTPAGFQVDMERPYDIIHSPGGVITRPAYQVPDWKVTRNDSHVYTQIVDPNRYIRFYTKWPDGVVQESIVEINEMLDYQKHEINADLRRDAYRPEGEVRTTQLAVHKQINDMKPIAEVKELMLTDEHQPVRMAVEFQGSTDMENEVESRKMLRADLGLARDAKLPAHEYVSSRAHLIDISDEGFEQLMGSLDTNDLINVAKDLGLHTRQGVLTPRVFNFINGRLTNEVNSFLKDAMSLDVTIEDFAEDIAPLQDHLATLGDKYLKLLKDSSQLILARSVQLHKVVDEDGSVQYSINDQFVNLQTGWDLSELVDGKLSEEAQLVSSYTHQAMIDAIKGMYGRATPAQRILSRFRVITLDGAYMEIFKGVLVENAFMFKRVA